MKNAICAGANVSGPRRISFKNSSVFEFMCGEGFFSEKALYLVQLVVEITDGENEVREAAA